MFKKLKMFTRAYKAMRAAEKSGLSREEAKMKALNEILSEDIPELGSFNELDIADIPEEALAYFEDDARSHIWDEEAANAFALTQTHIDTLRRVRLGWDGAESGGANFDPEKPFTFEGSPLDFMQVQFSAADENQHARLYVELVWAINEYFNRVDIEPSVYPIRNISSEDIARHMSGYGERMGGADFGLTPDGQVNLTQDMITVLKQTPWEWSLYGYEDECGWPGPAIDAKRPYGDMSYWELDMARILGWEMEKDADGYFRTTDAQDAALQALHLTQLACAQAILENGQISL